MKRYFALLPALALVQSLCAQSVQEKIVTLVDAYKQQQLFNGSVLVARQGTVIYQGAAGWQDAAKRTPNTANGIFQIGSVTKQFTSAIIMQLQQEGRLSVHDHLDKYLPGFPNGGKITLENLLTHTSGLHNYTDDTSFMKGDLRKSYDVAGLTTRFAAYAPDFEPGTDWKYSNTGYYLLGRVIEKVTGQPYEKAVRARIFTPLGMSHSGFDFTHLSDADKTEPYILLTATGHVPATIVDSTIAYSAGALYSTVGDLYKWERSIYTGKILSPASWTTVFTPYRHNYGYGWDIDTLYGRTSISHGGSIPGYQSYILRIPADELVVIVLDNSSKPQEALAHSLAALVLGQPYVVPGTAVEMTVPEATLKQYVGVYELAPTFSITVTLEGGGLKAQATGQRAFDLYPEKENLFFLKVVPAKVEFTKDNTGAVDGLILYQNGQQPRAKKIK